MTGTLAPGSRGEVVAMTVLSRVLLRLPHAHRCIRTLLLSPSLSTCCGGSLFYLYHFGWLLLGALSHLFLLLLVIPLPWLFLVFPTTTSLSSFTDRWIVVRIFLPVSLSQFLFPFSFDFLYLFSTFVISFIRTCNSIREIAIFLCERKFIDWIGLWLTNMNMNGLRLYLRIITR